MRAQLGHAGRQRPRTCEDDIHRMTAARDPRPASVGDELDECYLLRALGTPGPPPRHVPRSKHSQRQE